MIDIKFAIKRLYNKIYIPVKKKEFGKCGKNGKLPKLAY